MSLDSAKGFDESVQHIIIPRLGIAHDHEDAGAPLAGECRDQLSYGNSVLIGAFINGDIGFLAADGHLFDFLQLQADPAPTGLLFEGLTELFFHLLRVR